MKKLTIVVALLLSLVSFAQETEEETYTIKTFK